MTAKPLVSVLINNYNYGSFIRQAIDSVLSQTYSNFELIIVDDGSTDDSVKIINSYDDSRIIKVFQENCGQAETFNVGFSRSQGELIAFLDSDDWWAPEKIQVVVEWNEFLVGNFAMLQHFVNVWDDGKVKRFHAALFSGDYFEQTQRGLLRGSCFTGTSGLVFKRAILENIMPVPKELRIAADAYLTRATFPHGLIYSIPKVLGYYRKHSNAVLGNNQFDCSSFFSDQLFPLINSYYEKLGLGYRFK
jgi:glycosyltransferase involved in cell wall biosynthesis